DDATVTVNVFSKGGSEAVPEVEPGDGWAKNDAASIGAWRSGLIRVDANDAFGRDAGAEIVAVDGKPIMPGGEVFVRDGRIGMSPRGTLNFVPEKGWQMEPIWLPAPEAVMARLIEISTSGYQNSTLIEHLGWSLIRVLAGFFFGAMVGIPL